MARAQQQETMEFKQDEIIFKPMQEVCALHPILHAWMRAGSVQESSGGLHVPCS